MKIFRLISFLWLLLTGLVVQASNNQHHQQLLFETDSVNKIPYRIPAIAQCRNGNLIAVSDFRYCGSDIGYGAVDLVYRISKDYGNTWSPIAKLADGHGDENHIQWDYAFGDCGLVANRTNSEVLAVCVAGKTVYFQGKRNNPNRVAVFRSNDNGKTWDKGHEITEQIYRLFDGRKQGPIQSLFFTSGRIHQSRYVKVGKYYRLYSGLCTLSGNFIVYSDDFGHQWKVLGNIDESPCKDGDEVKCEELPDGSLILSSRAEGRMLNIFTFTNIKKGEGHWDSRQTASDMAHIKNQCNGEILVLPVVRKSDGQETYLALQSVPFGPQRTNVGIFYKEIGKKHLSALEFASHWKRGMLVHPGPSSYSTMIAQKDGRIGFLCEVGQKNNHISYQSLDVEEITNNEFVLSKKRFKKGY